MSASNIASEEYSLRTRLPNSWTLYRYNKNDFETLAKNIQTERQLEPYIKIGELDDINSIAYLTQLLLSPVQIQSRDGTTHDSLNINLHNLVIMRQNILPIWETPENERGGTLSLVVDADRGVELFRSLLCLVLGHTLTEGSTTTRSWTHSNGEELQGDSPYQINGISVSYLNSRKTGEQSYYIKIWDGVANRNLDQFLECLGPEAKTVLGTTEMRYTFNNKKRNYNNGIMKDIVLCDTGCYGRRGTPRARRGGRGGRTRR